MTKFIQTFLLALLPIALHAEEIIPLNYNSNNSETDAVKAIISNDANIVETLYKDLDQDGVADNLDLCTNSILNVKVDKNGCELDTDMDKVYDRLDQCPDTAPGATVNVFGCEGDEDLDGVLDSQDQCPETAEGVMVDEVGCKKDLDTDKDGVENEKDLCPETAAGTTVNEHGCKPVDFVMTNINFDPDQHIINPDQADTLKSDAAKLQKLRADEVVVITGHTDWKASQSHNLPLSWRRANSAKQFIIDEFGFNPDVIYIDGKGELEPIADNKTEEGRYKNRRIEMKVLLKTYVPSSAKLVIPQSMTK